MVKLSIIILSYNTSDLTYYCVQSILSNFKKNIDNGDMEVIIFDNNSNDSTVERLRKFLDKQKNVFIIESKENLGFSKGNNKASKHAKGEYLLFLNSDTQILDQSILKMIDFMDTKKEIGISGAVLKIIAGPPQLSAGKFFNLKNVFFMLFGQEHLVRFSPKETKEVDWVSGGCMLIRKRVFEKLSGFDENIFMYMEDVELCYRVKKEDLKVYFYSPASIMHIGEGSSNREFAITHIYKGLLYFYKKHKSRLEYGILVILLKIKAALAIFFGTILRDHTLVQTYKNAIAI